MDAALLTMISTLFVALLGNSWHQSRENSKTRELMINLNEGTRLELRNLGDELRADHKELRADHKKLGDELRADHKKLGDELRADHRTLGGELRDDIRTLDVGLGHVRERLSRIEGHMGIGVARPLNPPTED